MALSTPYNLNSIMLNQKTGLSKSGYIINGKLPTCLRKPSFVGESNLNIKLSFWWNTKYDYVLFKYSNNLFSNNNHSPHIYNITKKCSLCLNIHKTSIIETIKCCPVLHNSKIKLLN